MPDLGSAGGIGAIAGGVGDLFGGIFGDIAAGDQATGYKAEGAAYRTAQTYAQQNAVISQEAGDIKEEQAKRQIFKVLGAQSAEYSGAGLTSGGSAQEVMRDSVSQGSLEKAIINEQTQINVTGYKEQAAQFGGMAAAADAAASAAKAAGTGDLLGGIFKAAATILPFVL